MRAERRVSAVAAGAVCALVAGLQTNLGDYGLPTPGADNAAPAIAALIHGDVGSAIDLQPAAPFAALAGGDEVWRYRLGALACLPAARSCSGSRSPRP